MNLIDWLRNRTRPAYPLVDYPTVVEGYVEGPLLRLESLEGDETYLESKDTPAWTGAGFRLINYGPKVIAGKVYAVTHLQKYSKSGWLKMSPDCYHHWYFWKPQQKDSSGGWIPGSEQGLYFRKPMSWRWDKAGTFEDGALRHWIWTMGIIAGHWD